MSIFIDKNIGRNNKEIFTCSYFSMHILALIAKRSTNIILGGRQIKATGFHGARTWSELMPILTDSTHSASASYANFLIT